MILLWVSSFSPVEVIAGWLMILAVTFLLQSDCCLSLAPPGGAPFSSPPRRPSSSSVRRISSGFYPLSPFYYRRENNRSSSWLLRGSTENDHEDIPTLTTPPEAAEIKTLLKNLFSVCAHIQDPNLYSPSWADHATIIDQEEEGGQQQQHRVLVASSPIARGSIVSLYPLDAVGMRSTTEKRKKLKKAVKRREQTKDFLVFDNDKDGNYFQVMLSQSLKKSTPIISDNRIKLPLSVVVHDDDDGEGSDEEIHQQEIFIDINPTKTELSNPGWLGHLATTEFDVSKANCVVVPIMGATPFCALVATNNIPEGTQLNCLSSDLLPPEISQQYSNHLETKYQNEIAELAGYLELAYQPTPFQQYPAPKKVVVQEEQESEEEEGSTSKTTSTTTFQSPFYKINMDYPGIRFLHRDPDIIVIDNFLTEEECDCITQNAASHLIPCVIKHPVTGKVMEDPSRTSTNANLPQSDVPTIVNKFVQLTNCVDATHLETLQVLRYTAGQFFHKHTDGFDGATTACGFEESGRLVTIFCYLNNVEAGGETRFTNLQQPQTTQQDDDSHSEPESLLSIKPRKGMAVVHFPATIGLEEDVRTEHEGAETIDEKWLLVTWMWKDPRTDPNYDEKIFPSIMG